MHVCAGVFVRVDARGQQQVSSSITLTLLFNSNMLCIFSMCIQACTCPTVYVYIKEGLLGVSPSTVGSGELNLGHQLVQQEHLLTELFFFF